MKSLLSSIKKHFLRYFLQQISAVILFLNLSLKKNFCDIFAISRRMEAP